MPDFHHANLHYTKLARVQLYDLASVYFSWKLGEMVGIFYD
jgi:hypothetical protein